MKKKTTKNPDCDATLTEVIALRIELELKDELEKEMKEKGIHRMSKYIRMIIDKRKSSTGMPDDNDSIGRQEYETLAELYKKLASEMAMIQRLKTPDGRPVYDTKALQGSMNELKDATTKLVSTLKKHIDGNSGSK